MAKEPPPASATPAAAATGPGSSDSTPTLTLPASQFAKLAPSAYLAAQLPGRRPNGRTPQAARQPTLHANSLTHAHGSAVVRLGDTAVVCGVRGELVTASSVLHRAEDLVGLAGIRDGDGDEGSGGQDAEQMAALGLVVPNIELATGCSPLYLPGNPPTALAQSLTHRVLTLLRVTDLLRMRDLRVWAAPVLDAGKDDMDDDAMEEDEDQEKRDDDLRSPRVMAFWTLYIDILVISLDGAPFDAAWAAVVGALRNTYLPRAWWDRDAEKVLCDPRPQQMQQLRLRGCPVALSFAAFSPPLRVGSKRTGDQIHVLVDPDDFEESCCAQTITLVVDHGGSRILRVEMDGGTLLDVEDMDRLVKRAGQRWNEWKFLLDAP